MSYDPGQPTPVRQNSDGSFAVDSFRSNDSYRVTLEPTGCTCKQFTIRLAGTDGVCKHIEEVRRQLPFLRAAARARELTDAALDQYLARYANHPVIGGALRLERARRRFEFDFYQAQQAEAERCLRELQEKRPPIGTSVKVYGPLTEQEAFGGIR